MSVPENAMKIDASTTPHPGGSTSDADPAVIVVRFPATYAWLAMGFATVFFLLGLFIILLNPHRNLRPGLVISAAALAAGIAANNWRHHLHVVARLTPQQLILRRDGAVNWTDIAAIDVKEIHS